MKQPWRAWKRKTKQEKAALESLKEGKKIILDNIKKDKIMAIYVKGSFIRREMNERSDVDILTIVKDSRDLKKIEELDKEYKRSFKPKLQLLGMSMKELKTGKRIPSDKPNPNPSRTLKQIQDYILIYGEKLDTEILKKRTDKADLENLIGAFGKIFLPSYLIGKIGFDEIAKQVFWLVELEQRIQGKKPPYGFKKLAKSIKDKNHIVHFALKYRLNKPKDVNERKEFIFRLRIYLDKLKKIK
jgi:predicted nucleotidyltransferase